MRVGAAMLALVALQCVASAQHCTTLREQSNTTEKHVIINGAKVPVLVYGGGGGSERAGTALLTVLLRHVLRYVVRPVRERAALCRLARARASGAAVAVAARSGLCVAYAGLVSSLAPAAVPLTLQAHAHFARAPPAALCSTPFSPEPCAVSACGFATSAEIGYESDTQCNDSCNKCIGILARNESIYDRGVLGAMEKLLKNGYCFRPYSSDLLFRKALLQLQHKKLSFLFLDEDLWTDAPDVRKVQMPFCTRPDDCSMFKSVQAVRIGNGFILDRNAPIISRAVSKFSPTSEQLRTILEYEAANKTKDIEEAACLWANQHKSELKEWLFTHDISFRNIYEISVYLCNGDVLNDYIDIINIISFYIEKNISTLKFNITITMIDCNRADVILNEIAALSSIPTVAGVVMWDWFKELKTALEHAKRLELPFVLAGAPGAVRPGADLAQALRHFLHESQWSRFVILSDGSDYSESIKHDLRFGENFIVFDTIVTPHNLRSELGKLRKLDARVFFINANWKITAEILCTAVQMGLASEDTFAWIVRDWRYTDCNGTQFMSNIHHYSLGTSWRGGPAFSGSPKLREKLRSIWNVTKMPTNDEYRWGELGGPPGASLIADAILQVAYGFEKFYQNYGEFLVDIRGYNNTE